ncbi:unnamed protein product [Closterium sp. NIES-65]|nr:unnamed protein product [Closterium sp. NIES-65]
MGTHKAELAQWRALAERQVAEVAYVKATAAHSEARINDLELALAALKDGGAGRSRDERKEGSAGKHEGPERRREGKKRKREATGKKEGLVDAAGHALVATGGVLPVETGNEVERQAAAQGVGNSSATCDTEAELKGLRTRVEALEAMSVVGGRTWECVHADSDADMAAAAEGMWSNRGGRERVASGGEREYGAQRHMVNEGHEQEVRPSHAITHPIQCIHVGAAHHPVAFPLSLMRPDAHVVAFPLLPNAPPLPHPFMSETLLLPHRQQLLPREVVNGSEVGQGMAL